MKEFLKDLARWWDDPMTQALAAGLGTLLLLREFARVDEALDRVDRLELWASAAERRIPR